jgi:hypothetical protein
MLLLYNLRYKLWYIVIANLDHRMYVLCIDSILLNINIKHEKLRNQWG